MGLAERIQDNVYIQIPLTREMYDPDSDEGMTDEQKNAFLDAILAHYAKENDER